MDNSDFGAGFIFGMLVTAVALGLGLLLADLIAQAQYKNDAGTACLFHKGVRLRGPGLVVCKDGSSWAWQEGYTRRVGR
jgi:hypothetical protein